MDEMGKNISGSGMDTNVVGRPFIQKVPQRPTIRRLFVRDLTPESEGNAIGIGMADFTTRRLVEKMNDTAMYMNAITGGFPDSVKIPMALVTDREVIQVALGMIGLTSPQQASVARIQNTRHLTELDVSEALLPQVKVRERLSIVGEPAPFAFDSKGNLCAF